MVSLWIIWRRLFKPDLTDDFENEPKQRSETLLLRFVKKFIFGGCLHI